MIPYDILPHCMNPQRGYLVTANHRSIQSFYTVPFGNMTGSAGDTDRGLRIKERILEQLEKHGPFAPEDVLAIHYDSVNVWKREIVRLGYKVLRARSRGTLGQPRARHSAICKAWYDNGAATDMSVPGTELVNEMNVIFRGNVSGLVSKYGGGVSGLARFAKTVRGTGRCRSRRARLRMTNDCSWITVLDQAWTRTESKYGPDSKLWHVLAREAICRAENWATWRVSTGFPALDPRYDMRPYRC